ncbi:uncharacterized protein LOC132728288 [Ruditapes philippinarum]|uniref:uncharacterized protein LOC132728288 n=1 Tax=Ruditapes philippinarum TaxID=129788 RepID=UPI00295AB8E6|nr:uncharacterized protein LOC132728288 [Ruditapes philippinarum]
MLQTALFVVVTITFYVHVSATNLHMYVSPTGVDTNDGLSDKTPVKNIEQAIRNVKNVKHNNDTLYIELMAGYHDLPRTLHLDSKTTIRAYNQQEVHVTGGRRIPVANIKRVTDKAVLARLPTNARQHIRVVNLHELNITNYGRTEKYGSNVKRSTTLEVFVNGIPLHVTRWPNKGYLDAVEFPDGKQGLRFRYNSTVPQTWQNESDPWVYGYWYAGWSDGAIKVTSLDTKSMTVTLAEKPPHGFRLLGNWDAFQQGKAAHDGGYFRFWNILSELDEPGEYYMDRDSGHLYMWLPNQDGNVKQSDVIYISMISDCILINTRAKDVELTGFTLEACRKTGIFARSVHNVRLNEVEVKNTGHMAVRFVGDCRECEISQCYIHDTCGGISVSGGNRNKLESSGNIVQHNEFEQFSRVGAAGNDAISVSGEGHTVAHNHIHDGEAGAIGFYGNDNILEYNLVHHVCTTLSSCNAIRTGYDWTYRGNFIRNNIIHHSLRLVPGNSNKAIYLDGQGSGTQILDNVMYDNDIHVQIGGGRYNFITNNVMYNATRSSIAVDARGTSHRGDNGLYQHLHSVPYHDAAWSLRYPHLAHIDQENASLPEGNQITKNVIYASPKTGYIGGIPGFLKDNQSAYFNFTEIGFSSGSGDHFKPENGDFRIACKLWEWATRVKFHQVVSPNLVGPSLSPIGPSYLHRGLKYLVNTTYGQIPCPTLPSPNVPVAPFIPYGLYSNQIFPVEKIGCWLNVTKCQNHTAAIGTYRDMYGERYRHASANESMCFQRALEQWQFCGSHRRDPVVAIYGPTGNVTIRGEGCVEAWYGCPKHGGPADGHVNLTHGRYFHDNYKPAQTSEKICLERAVQIWRYCGSSTNYPITTVYLPTGAKRTAGGGCWITTESCPKHPQQSNIFYDADGATYYNTDESEFPCLHRAEYYWHNCGSDPNYPVTATFRPSTHSQTYP